MNSRAPNAPQANLTSVVIMGDLHLTRAPSPEVDHAIAEILRRHDEVDALMVAGDLFDFAADAPDIPVGKALGAIAESHPIAFSAMRAWVSRGKRIILLAGNHDAEVATIAGTRALTNALDLPEATDRVSTHVWFWRSKGLHVEHGHLYDPDNAPAHPLVHGARSLGVHFSAEFIHPTGAHRYLHANDSTPLKLFLAAFSWYGRRAPHVILEYFRTAFRAVAMSGSGFPLAIERARGGALSAAYGAQFGMAQDSVDRAAASGPEPTLASSWNTVMRMYLDRVFASTSLAASVALRLAGYRKLSNLAGLVGGGVMSTSWIAGHNRFGGTVPERLRIAAGELLRSADVGAVVFGHAHREHLADGYGNTGSFSFPDRDSGRPYLVATLADGAWRLQREHVATGERHQGA